MKQKVFAAKWTLKPVTTSPASCTNTFAEKCITPGFLYPLSLKSYKEFKGLAKTIIYAKYLTCNNYYVWLSICKIVLLKKM